MRSWRAGRDCAPLEPPLTWVTVTEGSYHVTQPACRGPVAEVEILHVQPVALVEPRRPRRASSRRISMNAPLTASTGPALDIGGAVLRERGRSAGAPAEAREVAERAERRRKGAARGVVEAAVLALEPAAADPDRAVGVHQLGSAIERPGRNARVRVQGEEVRGGRRAGARGSSLPRSRCSGPASTSSTLGSAAYELDRPVARVVVDDDDPQRTRGGCVGERAEAGAQELAATGRRRSRRRSRMPRSSAPRDAELDRDAAPHREPS